MEDETRCWRLDEPDGVVGKALKDWAPRGVEKLPSIPNKLILAVPSWCNAAGSPGQNAMCSVSSCDRVLNARPLPVGEECNESHSGGYSSGSVLRNVLMYNNKNNSMGEKCIAQYEQDKRRSVCGVLVSDQVSNSGICMP